MMPNDSLLSNAVAPVLSVHDSFPAFYRSPNSCPNFGYGPTPIAPISVWKCIERLLSKNAGINVGIPIPKFTYIPSVNSYAALLAILFLVAFIFPYGLISKYII